MSNSDSSIDIILKILTGKKGDTGYRPTPVHKVDDSSHLDSSVGIMHGLYHGHRIFPSLIATADSWCSGSSELR